MQGPAKARGAAVTPTPGQSARAAGATTGPPRHRSAPAPPPTAPAFPTLQLLLHFLTRQRKISVFKKHLVAANNWIKLCSPMFNIV